MGQQFGAVLLVVAAVLALVGLLALTGALSWFGRLPGDVRVQSDDGRVAFFAPIASMLLISLVVTLALALLRRIF